MIGKDDTRDGTLAPAAPVAAYASIFDMLAGEVDEQEARVFAEREAARKAVEDLLRHPPSRRTMLVANSGRFQTLSLSYLLVKASHRKGFEDPAESLSLAELACQVADTLDSERYSTYSLADARAHCRGQLGNARRINSDLRGAETAFEEAQRYLQQGTHDSLEAARLLDLVASLRKVQYRLDEGKELVEAAIGLYREVGDCHMAGRAMIKLASIYADLDQPESMLESLRAGLSLIDAETEPTVALSAAQNLTFALLKLGRHEEALVSLGQTSKILDGLEDARVARIRNRAVEGEIYAAMGRRQKAETAFLMARQGFCRMQLGVEASLVSLKLAELYLEMGQFARLQRLVADTAPIFEALELKTDAMAALLLFRKSVEAESLGLEVLHSLRSHLESANAESGRTRS